MSEMLDLWELPNGWAWAEFHQVAKVASNLVDPASFPDAPHIAPNHIESGTGKLLGFTTVAEDRVRSAKHRFFPGHILYSKIRPYLCKAVVVDFGGLCSADMYPISSEIDTSYLHRWIVSKAFTEMTSKHEGRTLLPKINQEALALLSVPVAPLAEQRRIVAAVEPLLERVLSARDRLERVPSTLKRFRQAVFAAACSGGLTAEWRETNSPGEWKSTTLDQLVKEKPRNGFSPKAVDRPTSVKSLTLTATTSGVFKPEHYKNIDMELPKESYLWLQPGDILIQRSNTIEYVGVSAIFHGNANEFIYPDLMMKMQAKEGVEPRFLWCALSDEKTRNYFRANATGTAGNMPKINQSIVCGAPINLPTLKEQIEVVRQVFVLLALADSIERRAQSALMRVERLTHAVLAKAFRGELVPTEAELARREGRSYEPASELLGRIKASMNGEAKRTRGKKTPKRSSASGENSLDFMES